MKKTYLSAAAVAAALALPGLAGARRRPTKSPSASPISTTGPAAALGIPERNALDFVPKEIGGVPLKLIVLDDGGDPTAATTNTRRFVTESKADIIMGSSHHAADDRGLHRAPTKPAFRISAWRRSRSTRRARNGRSIMPQPIPIMGKVLYEHMKAHGIKTVGYIGYSDSYGDLWVNDFKAAGPCRWA